MNKKSSNMRGFISLIAFLFCQMSFPQGYVVKEFKQNLNDGSAFHAPMDTERHPCGLIKVRTDNPDLQFKGDIVGDVENKMNEYWVYVSQGCQQLRINHPNFMPLVIPFSDYGIDISSKTTYILTLAETKYKKEKTGVTIIVKPENTELYIDDVFVDNMNGNGYYQLYLPKGEHVCKLSKAGYRPNVQVVQTGKGSQNINVELESVMAELEVKCKTATAEIYVDSEFKGNGMWKGELLAGEHNIEARQQNFNSHSQTVTLLEKDSKAIVVPELKRSKGTLNIKTMPADVPVIIDGEPMGKSPCLVELETGTHIVTYNKNGEYGCLPYKDTVVVEAGITLPLKINLIIREDQGIDYKAAYRGDENIIIQLIEGSYRFPSYEEKVFWANRLCNINKIYSQAAIGIPGYIDCPNEEMFRERYYNVLLIYNPNMAVDVIRRAEQKGSFDGNEAYYWAHIGEAFMLKKDYQKAITYFNKAINRDSKFVTWGGAELSFDIFGIELGDCYKAIGKTKEAAHCYQLVLNLLDSSNNYDNRKRVEKKLKELE